MTEAHIAHIEPSRHSTKEVDQKLREVEQKVAQAPGAGSPAIKPRTDLGDDGNPVVARASVDPTPAQTPGIAVDPHGALQGEGNVDASRRFDKAEHDFVDAGKVAAGAAAAAPKNSQEARDMADAEREGLSHKKG